MRDDLGEDAGAEARVLELLHHRYRVSLSSASGTGVTGRLQQGPAKTAIWIALLCGDSGPCLLAVAFNETMQYNPNDIPPVVMYNPFIVTKWQTP